MTWTNIVSHALVFLSESVLASLHGDMCCSHPDTDPLDLCDGWLSCRVPSVHASDFDLARNAVFSLDSDAVLIGFACMINWLGSVGCSI